MYKIERYIDKFETYRIGTEDSDTYFEVVPPRGGIITDFLYKNKTILYLDKETLYDITKSIRGGIPVLFPICGKLQDDIYHVGDVDYSMPQHGIARRYPWRVVDAFVGHHGADITLCFSSDEETKKIYPFDFRIIYRYELTENRLTLYQSYINDSCNRMPFYAGFHPYFYTSDKTAVSFDTGATRCWDSLASEMLNFNEAIDFDVPEVNMILLDPHAGHVSMNNRADGWVLSLKYDAAFKYVVIWSLKGRDFVCIEPWMARPNAMNTGEDVYYLEPHDQFNARLSLAVDLTGGDNGCAL